MSHRSSNQNATETAVIAAVAAMDFASVEVAAVEIFAARQVVAFEIGAAQRVAAASASVISSSVHIWRRRANPTANFLRRMRVDRGAGSFEGYFGEAGLDYPEGSRENRIDSHREKARRRSASDHFGCFRVNSIFRETDKFFFYNF